MKTTAQATWFVHDRCPETRYRAVGIGADENGAPAPVVTAPTLVTLLLDAVSDPSSSYLAFAIDTSGRCTLQDREDRVTTLRPDRDGLYNLGGLGWTFRTPASTAAEST
jgi:hypothetical protein